MKIANCVIIGVILSLVTPWSLVGQGSQATKAFAAENYTDVVNILSDVTIKDNVDLLLIRGSAYAELGLVSNALPDLARAKTLGSTDPSLYYYLGKTYLHRGRYNDAIEWFSRYLSTNSKNGMQGEDKVYSLIRQANTASSIKFDDSIIVEYCEGDINSLFDNTRPVFSRSADNRVYYTDQYNGSKIIKGMSFLQGKWSEEANLPPALNIVGENLLNDISGDGQVIFFENTQGKKVFNLYNKLEASDKNIFFQAPYFPHLGDRDLQIVDDKTIVFSSLRPDSQGGYDIYISTYESDRWSEPKNLGDKINSASDEVSPFMTTDGTTVYFSSNRTESLGGYDIFKSTRSVVKSKSYKAAVNVGAPLNSPGDDLYFRVDGNGLRCVFSSDRPGGKGGLDIYLAYLNVPAAKVIVDASHLSFIKYENGSTESVIASTPSSDKSDVAMIDEKKLQEQKRKDAEKRNEEEQNRLAEKQRMEEQKQKEDAKLLAEQNKIAEQKRKDEEKMLAEQQKKAEHQRKDEAKAVSDQNKKEEEKMLAKQQKMAEQKNKDEQRMLVEQEKEAEERRNEEARLLAEKQKKAEKEKRKKERKGIPVITVTDVAIPILFYETEDLLLGNSNKQKLDQIAVYLQGLPDNTVVELTNFTYENARKEYELFFSVNQLDEMIQYLSDKGISRNRIITNSVGSAYPFVEANLGGHASEDHLKLNQRIEVNFYNIPKDIPVSREAVEIPDSRLSRPYQVFSSVKSDVHYRLLFEETNRIFKNRVLTYYDDVIVTKQIDDETYLYALGFFQTYDSAKRVQQEILRKNLPDAKIVPYYGSAPLNDRDVLKLAPKHPNLRAYVDSL